MPVKKNNWWLLGLVAGILLFWVAMDWPCLIRHFTGIPCASCGLSRAWLAVLRLDLRAALSFHPMFWAVPVLGVYLLRWGKPLFPVEKWVYGLTLTVYILCYIFRLVAWANGQPVF